MKFTNIENFERRMNDNGVTASFFTIQYHECAIETVYSINQRKFLFGFVDHNIGFTCSLDRTIANGYINHEKAVKKLMICRKHDTYAPIHFYDFLNSSLPTVVFNQINNEQYINILKTAVSNFEDRIYFNHWRKAKISERQGAKTIELMGNMVVKFCKNNHLTPVFWSTPTERTLATFDNFVEDYNNHGIQQ